MRLFVWLDELAMILRWYVVILSTTVNQYLLFIFHLLTNVKNLMLFLCRSNLWQIYSTIFVGHVCMLWAYNANTTWSNPGPRQCQHYCSSHTVYSMKYARGCAAHCFILLIQPACVDSNKKCSRILSGCLTDTGTIIWLPVNPWSNHEDNGWNWFLVSFGV